MILRLLKKHIDALNNIYSRSQWMLYFYFYMLAGAFANLGAKQGIHSFSAWLLLLIIIFTIFRNAMDMAEVGN